MFHTRVNIESLTKYSSVGREAHEICPDVMGDLDTTATVWIPSIKTFYASDDSTFMTGSILLIDGGAANVDVAGAALTMAGVNWGVSE